MAARDIVIPADAGAVAIVDLDAIAENFRLIQATCPGADVGAAVKANAYGLGVGPVTATLAGAGCTTFFVATPAEGLQLRASDLTAEIVVLNGPEPGNIPAFHEGRLTATLNSLPQIETWRTAISEANGLICSAYTNCPNSGQEVASCMDPEAGHEWRGQRITQISASCVTAAQQESLPGQPLCPQPEASDQRWGMDLFWQFFQRYQRLP